MVTPAFIPFLPVASAGGASSFLRTNVTTKKPLPRANKSVHTTRMQVWSDPAVREEYFDYLEGRVQRTETADCQSTIVGAGRIGSFLAEKGKNDLVIKRGESIPPDAPGPVYVCTRNDDMAQVIADCPEEKLEDLVFIQNGMLERFLREKNVSDNTCANLYFAIPRIGAKPIDGITDKNPEGLTAVCGKWEGAVADRLQNANLTCKILKERDFRRSQLEKLIWISCFNLIGAVHGGITMGEVAKMHVDEVTEMGTELAQMVRFTLTVGMLSNIEDRLLAYGRRVKDFPTAVKEFPWRNGFFYDYTQLAKKNGFPDPTPMHT